MGNKERHIDYSVRKKKWDTGPEYSTVEDILESRKSVIYNETFVVPATSPPKDIQKVITACDGRIVLYYSDENNFAFRKSIAGGKNSWAYKFLRMEMDKFCKEIGKLKGTWK